MVVDASKCGLVPLLNTHRGENEKGVGVSYFKKETHHIILYLHTRMYTHRDARLQLAGERLLVLLARKGLLVGAGSLNGHAVHHVVVHGLDPDGGELECDGAGAGGGHRRVGGGGRGGLQQFGWMWGCGAVGGLGWVGRD